MRNFLSPLCQVSCLALGISCGFCFGQTPDRVDSAGGGAAVHLEPHEGRTSFRIGDPVILDLVFASRSPGYIVTTDNNPNQPASDEIDIAPDGGWVRTHSSFRGQGLNGNAVTTLAGDPVRVPVLLNRTITFLKPGHYEVAVVTERLRTSENMFESTSLESCKPCRKTNSVGIDIAQADDSEESALVVSLAHTLEETSKPPESSLSPEQKEASGHLAMELQQATGSTEADHKRQEALLQKLSEFVVSQQSAYQQRIGARRAAATRLACLGGDDAVRAKAHFIATETPEQSGDPDISIAPILVNGLTSSRNKRLQLALFEEAWQDPKLLPTYELQVALRQARELTQKDWVTDEAVVWAGTTAEHHSALEEYQREINEIMATLPLRSQENRAETITFLKSLAVPNPFNQSQNPIHTSN